METPILSSLDFEDIKGALKFFLKYNTKFSDYNYVGSNISQLLDVLAYNTFINSYNINFAVNELSLDTATIRDNVTSIAQRIGYSPQNYNSSLVLVDLVVTGLTGAEFCSIEPSSVLISNNTDVLYKFNNISTITAPVNSNGNCKFERVSLLEGDFLSVDYIVDSSDSEQRFIIPNETVSKNSITVIVNSEVYTSSVNIIKDSPDDLVFYTNYVQDGQLEIVFGENVFGKQPNTGDLISIKYLVNNGILANGISNFSYVGTINSYYANITNGVPVNISNITYSTSTSDYGTGLESLSSIKFFAPRSYAAQQRAVTYIDYQSIIKNIYPNTKKVSVIGGENLNPPRYGAVQLIISTIDGRKITNNIKNNIINILKKSNVVSITPFIIDANYTVLRITPIILYDAKKLTTSIDVLRNKISILISEFISGNISSEFYGNKLQSDIYNIDKSIIAVKLKIILKQIQTQSKSVKKYSGNFGTNVSNKNCSQIKLISSPFKISTAKQYVRLVSSADEIRLEQYTNTSTDKNWSTLVSYIGNISSDGSYEYVVPSTDYSVGIISIPDDIDIIPTEDVVLIPEIVNPYITDIPEEFKDIDETDLLSEPELDIDDSATDISADVSTITIEDIILENSNDSC